MKEWKLLVERIYKRDDGNYSGMILQIDSAVVPQMNSSVVYNSYDMRVESVTYDYDLSVVYVRAKDFRS